jgi:predicted nucleic acid-binding protein
LEFGEVLKLRNGFVNLKSEPSSAVVFDTNILLYLVSKDEYFQFLVKLQMLIANNHLALIVPEQVKNEFYNNLENVIEAKKKNIKRIRNESKSLIDYLSTFSDDLKNSFSSALDLLEKEEEKVFLRNLHKKVACLKLLFELRAVEVETTDAIRIEATNLALEKSAPFFGDKQNGNNKQFNKLSMGDAIIFLTTTEFFKSSSYSKKYFLTENADDFCKPGKKHELHDNLIPLATESNLNYYINIAKFVNEIIDQVGTTPSLTKVKQEVIEKVENEVISKCKNCNDPEAELGGYYAPSPFGFTWWERCTKCGATWYTDEYLEC